MSTLALFDLDGTLTHGDTMLAFIRHRLGAVKFMGMLFVAGSMDVLGKIGIVPADAGKKRLMRKAFTDAKVSDVAKDAERFAREEMPGMMRHGALERVRWHLLEGHRVIVVSASCGAWLRPWCEANGVELIATELETRDGHYTGALSTPNCKAEEKVRRLRETVDLRAYGSIHAYGDTPSDRSMLAVATDPYYKPFHVIFDDAPDEPETVDTQGHGALSSGSFKWVAGLVAVLAVVGAVLVRQAFKPITEVVAQGSYTRVLEAFPRHGDWPDGIRFLPGHRVKLEDPDGYVHYEGPWTWDAKSTSLRLATPAWDRRVLWVPGWGGPVLKVASPVGKDLFQTVTFKRVE